MVPYDFFYEIRAFERQRLGMMPHIIIVRDTVINVSVSLIAEGYRTDGLF